MVAVVAGPQVDFHAVKKWALQQGWKDSFFFFFFGEIFSGFLGLIIGRFSAVDFWSPRRSFSSHPDLKIKRKC